MELGKCCIPDLKQVSILDSVLCSNLGDIASFSKQQMTKKGYFTIKERT
jgi:hypothetical protein